MLTETQRTHLAQGAAEWGIALDENALNRFARFAELLEEANRHLNLTRVPPEDYVTLHFLDSLILAAVHSFSPGLRVLDVGTGAGFPGLPLAFAFPDVSFILMDATRKRLDFLNSVIAELGLANVETLHGRAEDVQRLPAHRARYDVVTARAVAKMETLANWLLPFVRPNGVALACKSRNAEPEIEAARPVIHQLGGRIERITDLVLPQTDIPRKIVLLRKETGTREEGKGKSPPRITRRNTH